MSPGVVPQPPAPISSDHFWWRPGWQPGRSYLTWHVVVGDDPGAVAALAPLRDALHGLDHLAPVPDRRLHVTGPGVGFTDTVGQEERTAMVAGVRAALAGTTPLRVHLDSPWVAEQAVGVSADVAGRRSLTDLRDRIEQAMTGVGLQAPGLQDQEAYRPHVSLAYSTGPAPTLPAHAALEAAWAGAVPLHVHRVSLLALQMEPPGYTWDVMAQVDLGG